MKKENKLYYTKINSMEEGEKDIEQRGVWYG